MNDEIHNFNLHDNNGQGSVKKWYQLQGYPVKGNGGTAPTKHKEIRSFRKRRESHINCLKLGMFVLDKIYLLSVMVYTWKIFGNMLPFHKPLPISNYIIEYEVRHKKGIGHILLRNWRSIWQLIPYTTAFLEFINFCKIQLYKIILKLPDFKQ